VLYPVTSVFGPMLARSIAANRRKFAALRSIARYSPGNVFRAAFVGAVGAIASVSGANASCPVYQTLTNGTTADATQVMSNFDHVLQCPVFSGNVGIGTGTTPTDELSIQGDVNDFVGAQIANIHGSGSAGIRLVTDTGATTAATFRSFASGNPSSGLIKPSSTLLQTFGSEGLTIGSSYTGTSPDAVLSFATNNTVQMTIDTAGRVGIGGPAPSTLTLYVQGNAGGTSAWSNVSDARLKKNIVPIADALGLIEALQGVRFDWRTPDERNVGKTIKLPTNERQLGFVAQTVQAVLPEAASAQRDADGLLSVRESKIVPVLVEAVKQLAAIDNRLAAENRKLASAHTDLARQLADLKWQVEHREYPKNAGPAKAVDIASPSRTRLSER